MKRRRALLFSGPSVLHVRFRLFQKAFAHDINDLAPRLNLASDENEK